jgi:hypothetical protein
MSHQSVSDRLAHSPALLGDFGITLLSFLALVAAVVPGCLLGRMLAWDLGPLLIQFPCLGAFVFMIAEICAPGRRITGRKRLLAPGLLGFMVLLVYVDPFQWIDDSQDLLRSIALLVPVVVGFMIFVRREQVLAAIGAWFFLFGSLAVLGFNVVNWSRGVGFLMKWIS